MIPPRSIDPGRAARQNSEQVPTKITDFEFDLSREPLRKPLGFKGAEFNEKWICRVTLTGSRGFQATAHGGYSILWSDARVFLSHSECGGNALMAAVTEFGIQCARRVKFQSPLELQDKILTEVHDYACAVTRLPDLNPAFTLNALVAVDHAAWLLFAQERGLTNFEEFVATALPGRLPARHASVGCIPLLSYNTPRAEMVRLAEAGHFMFKINIGARGGPAEMLAADKERLEMIHTVMGGTSTPHTADGKIRYYLDANGRYRSRVQVEALLGFAEAKGFLDQIALFEEPFAEPRVEDVSGLPVIFTADESLRSVKDMAGILHAGYRAVTVKPAGKGLSATLRMIAEAMRRGAIVLVSDSSCTPLMLDWNKNVAARLPALPGLKMGMMEMNGQQNYTHWDRLLGQHPAAEQSWIKPERGMFRLPSSFYKHGGGIFANCGRNG
jgi:L-alanine-DL-glutamate epimerase-like enolase superfamily enzyme